jgi:hypothetical protein
MSDESELPSIDFSTFILSLSTSAIHHMGLGPGPDGETIGEANKPVAQHTIDTLGMLQEKTKGNLDEQEEKLLQSLLYELRMHFVKIGD